MCYHTAMKRRWGLPAGAAVLLAASVWGRRAWVVTHPVFETRAVETRSYRARYPSAWAPIDPRDPRLGDRELTFLNHRGLAPEAEPWDRARVAMTLRDEGPCASLDGFVSALRADSQGASPARSWPLANKAAAKTWSEAGPSVDIPSAMRWAALRGSNGRCYAAAWLESADWRTRLRYRSAFADILGSIEFKQ